MISELMTHWSEYTNAVRKILPLASKSIRIFDPDLVRPGLENPENVLVLRHFLAAPHTTLQIVLL